MATRDIDGHLGLSRSAVRPGPAIIWALGPAIALAMLSVGAPAGAQSRPLDQRFDVEELERERDAYVIEGPVVLTIGSAALVGAGVSTGSFIYLVDVAGDLDPDGGFGVAVSCFALGGLALVTLVAGAIWWGRNAYERRRIDRRLRQIEELPFFLGVSADQSGALASLVLEL